MHDVVILGAARTPIGAFQGSLSSLSSPQLGAVALRAAIARSGIDAARLDEVLMGCVLTGGMGQAPARQASLAAGIPNSVPCTTVNKVCGSGMKTVMFAAQAIRAGDARLVAAGGMESMSNAPYTLDKARSGYRMGHGKLVDTMISDGLWDPYKDVHMGNCGDSTSAALGFGREEIDAFAAESYRRARAAQVEGRFDAEIAPVQVPVRKGDPVTVSEDEEPGRGDPGKLSSLRPAFGAEGTTTAGNASSIDDGAAALVIGTMDAAREMNLVPLARIVASSQHAQEPEWFTTAPAFAIKKLLAKAGLAADQVDLYEVNEAFAVVAMAVAREVGIPHERLNVNGGAVALGHPIGATGARLLVTLAHELKRRGARYGIATPCIGGGEATAVLLEAF